MKTLGNIMAGCLVIGTIATIIKYPLMLLGLAVIVAVLWKVKWSDRVFPGDH